MTALPLLLAVALRAADASPAPVKAEAPKQSRTRTPKHAPTKAEYSAVPPAAAPEPAALAARPAAREDGHLLVEYKCAKCHDVSLAYSSSLSDASWRLHMKRMAARPGAAITDEQGRRIHEYLKATARRSAQR